MKNTLIFKENLVEKQFSCAVSYQRERDVYKVMSQTGLVPQFLEEEKDTLVLERIQGETLSVRLFMQPEETMLAMARKVAHWFCDFEVAYNQKTGRWLVLLDANPRNFICDGEKIYGIDFEKSEEGALQNALAEFCGWYISENDLIYECYEEILTVFESRFPQEDIHRINLLAMDTFDKIRQRRRVMKKIRNTDLCITAGGNSSRMGRPKGLLPFAGHTICHQLIYNLGIFDRIFLSANLEDYDVFSLERVGDKHKDIGPISAIHTALTNTTKDWVMLCPCDMPFINEKLVYHLFDCDFENRQAVIITDGEKPYPILGLYHKSALPTVEKHIAASSHRLRDILADLDTLYVPFYDKSILQNINTIEEYNNLTDK